MFLNPRKKWVPQGNGHTIIVSSLPWHQGVVTRKVAPYNYNNPRVQLQLLFVTAAALLWMSEQLAYGQEESSFAKINGFMAIGLALSNIWSFFTQPKTNCDNTERCGFFSFGYVQYTGIPGSLDCLERCIYFPSSQRQCGICGPVTPTISPAPTISQEPTQDPVVTAFEISLDLNLIPLFDRNIFVRAAEQWQRIITRGLSNVNVTGRNPSFPGCKYIDNVVKNLFICSRYDFDDGPGGALAYAGTDGIRRNNGLPFSGYMSFDVDDVGSYKANGLLAAIIKHEMGHLLGIGTLWAARGITKSDSSSNCPYLGEHANREYHRVSGCKTVPTELDGGRGTRCLHFDEECMGAELMTGYIDRDVSNPMSRITIAALEDLSYHVDYSKSESYTRMQVASQCRCRRFFWQNAAKNGGVGPLSSNLRLGERMLPWTDNNNNNSTISSIENNSKRSGHRRRLSTEMKEYAIQQGRAFLRNQYMIQQKQHPRTDNSLPDDEDDDVDVAWYEGRSVSVWVQDTDKSIFSVTVWAEDYE